VGESVRENGAVIPPLADGEPLRQIPDAGFGDDAGSAPADVTEALAAYATDEGRYAETLAVLLAARLLVPVVALLGEVEYDEAGLAHDKTSDMATVLLTGRDGRTALLAFTGMEQLRTWNPEARPVPVAARLAARSAVQDGADAMVIDVAGPVTFVVEGEDLTRVAAGWSLARVGEQPAWIGPAPE
jgi:hypothetical protein